MVRLPLRLVLTVSFVIIILATVGVTDYLAFRDRQEAVNDMVTQLFFEIDARVRQHLDNYLGTPFTINQINLNAMRQGQINGSNTEEMARYFWQQGQLFRGFGSMGFASDAGELAAANEPENYVIITSSAPTGMVLRRYAVGDDGRLTGNIQREVQNFDVHGRGWYQTAAKAGKPVWTDINPALTGRRLDLTAVTPYYDREGRLQGVFYLDVSLAQINRFLKNINISRSGKIFIMEPNGFIVASSTSEQPYVIKGDEIKRLNASASSEPLIASAADRIVEQFAGSTGLSGSYQSTFNIQGERHFLRVAPYHDTQGLDWYVVLIVPESDFMGHISDNYQNTLLLIVASLLLSTVVATLVARRVTQPLSRLSRSAKALSQGDWDQKLEMKRGDEVGDLADAFDTMTARLKENLASLRESEERFRTLVEQAPEAILVRDGDTGLFVDANRNAEKLFGCSREEILKSRPERFYPPSQPDNRPIEESMREYTARALAGETVTFERTVRNTAGREIMCQVWLIRLPSKDRRLIRGSFIDITERKRTEERLAKLNECFLGFGTDPVENINRLTALCGKLMGAACGLYNRLDKGLLCSWGQWNAPPGYNPVDKPQGHICYDTINAGSDEVLVVRNLPETVYARTDPNVTAYNLKTYVGRAVRLGGDYVGSLCVVYQNDFSPGEDDKKLMGIIASAIAVEEKRRQSEKSFMESEKRFRSIVESANDAIILSDSNGKLILWNKGAQAIFGYTEEEMIGKPASFMIPERYRKKVELIMATGRSDFFGKTVESTGYRKDGSEFPLEISFATWNIEKDAYYSVIIRDITERKRAEKKLREASLYTRSLIEVNLDPLITVNLEGKITDVNKAAELAAGLPREKLIGSDYSGYLTEPEKIKEGFSLVLSQGFVKDFPAAIRHISGKVTEVLFNASVYRNEAGEVQGVFAAARDITEQKRAQEQIELLKHSVDVHYDGAYWMDTDNRFIYVNDAGCRALGYTREELMGKYVGDVNPRATPERLKLVWEKLRKEGFFSAESVHRRKDGSEFPVEIMSTYVQFGGKEYNCGFAHNITERKQAEKNLRESETRYRTLFEQAGDYVMVLEMGPGNIASIVDMNEAALRAHGYSREEILGQPISFIDPEASPEKVGERKSQGGPGISLLLNVRHRRKDGSLFDVEANTQMVLIGGKQLVISVERDITERKRAEEELKRSKEFSETILNSMNHEISIIDVRDFRIVDVNQVVLDKLKMEKKDLIGKRCFEIIHRQDTPCIFPDNICPVLETKKTGKYSTAEHIHYNRDGTKEYVEVSASPIKDENGNVTQVVHIAKDITERKLAEEKIKTSLKEKEVLLREIHHRVKNNMQIISSLLRLQSENIKDEKYLGVFKDSYNRIKTMSLVHEKLYQSKDFTNINFKNYINDLVSSICQSHFIDKDIISLNMNIEDVYLGIDTAIPCGLVINELVTNSLKYAFPDGRKGEIRIDLHRIDNNNGFELVVADNGISIPERLDFRKTDTLGLRLVSILVEDQLLGEVNMDRSRGTEFTIKFRG